MSPRRAGTPSHSAIAVCIETGPTRVFASALEWPGWARSGQTEDTALEALDQYRDRYRAALAQSALDGPDDGALAVAVRVPGSATTDFGAPGQPAPSEESALDEAAAARTAALVAAGWTTFDSVASGAPAVLRKGPRGGGRDTAAIVEHLVSTDAVYARKIGFRERVPAPDDTDAVAQWRQALLQTLRTGLVADGPPAARQWPARYAARRIAWHALDHAWEIEDKRDPV